MMKILRSNLIMLLPVLLLLGACSANPATGKQSFTGFMSKEKELQVGAQEHPKIVKQFGGRLADKALAKYVRAMGLELAKTSEMPDLPWTFTVLNNTQVNAFALPGGYVYVTRGLLALASDEAELAGVLSHEIGHVTARHSAQRYSSTMAANIGVQVLGVLSGAGANLASLGANLALKSYSRDQELESDMLGVRYMSRIGYDPEALVSFFAKLRAHQRIEAKQAGRDENDVDKQNILATHPRTSDRIQQAITLAEDNGKNTNGKTLRRGAEPYLSRINGLVFGDDAEQGMVRGNVFIHPTLNFRFKVPKGFKIKNLPTLVIATHKNGAILKFAGASAERIRDAGGMKQFLRNKWGGNVALKNIEWIDINGMKAVTGAGTVWMGRANMDVRRILIEQKPGTYWRFQFETSPEQTARLNGPLRKTTYSFRTPSRGELAKAKPYRITVTEVGQGVSVKNLIDAMAVPEMKAEWFEALNGIKPDGTLKPGQKIKLVK